MDRRTTGLNRIEPDEMINHIRVTSSDSAGYEREHRFGTGGARYVVVITAALVAQHGNLD